MERGYKKGGRKGRGGKHGNRHGFFKRAFQPDIDDQGMMTLNQLKEGHHGIIHHLKGGPRAINRLAELGFVPGEEVRVVKNFGFGPVIVEIRGSRMGLGRGFSAKIIVNKLSIKENEDSEREEEVPFISSHSDQRDG